VNQRSAALQAGQARRESVRETLATHPRDGRLLFGLWQSLLEQKRQRGDPQQQQYEAA
jgi:hypothetical protein